MVDQGAAELSETTCSLGSVSEETARALETARTVHAGRLEAADDAKQRCLQLIATGIAGHLDEIARRAVHQQPDVAKQLGSDGIRTFRRALADGAAVLATDVESAAARVVWPVLGEYSPVTSATVRSALFDYLYGQRVNALGVIFKRHGFDVHDDNRQRTQGLILPQYLYDEQELQDVAQALHALGMAELDLEAAAAADDADVVDALWAGADDH